MALVPPAKYLRFCFTNFTVPTHLLKVPAALSVVLGADGPGHEGFH